MPRGVEKKLSHIVEMAGIWVNANSNTSAGLNSSQA